MRSAVRCATPEKRVMIGGFRRKVELEGFNRVGRQVYTRLLCSRQSVFARFCQTISSSESITSSNDMHPVLHPSAKYIFTIRVLVSNSLPGENRPMLEIGCSGILTKRETEILQLLADGHCNQQIADRLRITFRTVKFHTTNIYSKIGVRSRTAAVVWLWRKREGLAAS